jgi:PIN domain nuclease of toxin-antitoxin system
MTLMHPTRKSRLFLARRERAELDLLLDTHVLLWWDQNDAKLATAVRDMLANREHQVFVSAASPWEMAIKARRGRLIFRGSPAKMIEENGFLPLPITPEHGERAGSLPWEHADPFDRMLVAQALEEDLVLVHADTTIRTYGVVSQLWARA